MDVTKIDEMQHDNKENIPPFSLSNKPGPSTKKCKCTLVKMNECRRPLRDVTNIYRAAGRADFREFRQPSSVLVCSFSSNRKRKLVDDGAEQEHRSCSKILRKEYR
ncbi:hypothetical protein C2S51_037313 [Perilla frutescens var. frutescens]|nr:hypothetical protein C2S51_037313 [Perilla frutescens var. frutescens]